MNGPKMYARELSPSRDLIKHEGRWRAMEHVVPLGLERLEIVLRGGWYVRVPRDQLYETRPRKRRAE